MASESFPVPPPSRSNSSDYLALQVRKLQYLLQGKYDVDAALGADVRDALAPDYVDNSALVVKTSMAFPVKLWGYDGLEVLDLDPNRTPQNSDVPLPYTNTTDYAVSVMTRERTNRKAFAVFAFDGYDDSGNLLKHVVMEVQGDALYAVPYNNLTGDTEPVLTQSFGFRSGMVIPYWGTREEILAWPDGWGPCDGGTYPDENGIMTLTPNLRGIGIRCANTNAEVGTSAGSDSATITNHVHGDDHTHTVGDHVHITGDHTHTVGDHVHITGDHTHNHSHSHLAPDHVHVVSNHTHDCSHNHAINGTTSTSQIGIPVGSGNLASAIGHFHNDTISVTTINTGNINGTVFSGNMGSALTGDASPTGAGGMNSAPSTSGMTSSPQTGGMNSAPSTSGMVFSPQTGGKSSGSFTSGISGGAPTISIVNRHVRLWLAIKL